MQLIHPITEESCRAHCGKPVLLFLHDGTEIHGVLSRVSEGKLYLNEETGAYASAKAKASRKKSKIKVVHTSKKAGKARNAGISNFEDPFMGTAPFFGLAEALVFDLALIGAILVLV